MWTGSVVGSETNGFKKRLHQRMQDAWGVVEEMTSVDVELKPFGGVTNEVFETLYTEPVQPVQPSPTQSNFLKGQSNLVQLH